ncbi:MAG: SdrD B-like domain-containing protein [Planctomycetota bacterium]
MSKILSLAAAALLATTATAQFCSDNTYPVHLVDAAGNELPTVFDPIIGEDTFVVPTETVFLAFDPALPTGTYYVHVTDTPIDGLDEVLSQNDPMDRFVHVENNAGVITLSLPMSGDPTTAVYGIGLGGVGQSIAVNPFSASQYSQCRFKVWYGDNWDLSNGPSNPYLLAGGLHPVTGLCAVRSYHSFRIGDGSGSDVCGTVFEDTNGNGTRDPGEPGLSGWTVSLADGGSATSTTSEADGSYCFLDVPAGNYTVELTVMAGYSPTTALAFPIEVCQCAPVAGGDFGVMPQMQNCDARTIGFWRNKHGLNLITQYDILPTLPALFIVNASGAYVAPATNNAYKTWLQQANAVNMAYMLSAQLVGMHCNVTVGFVGANCLIDDPDLGIVAIGAVMQMAVESLSDHPFTPSGHPQRAWQEKLKNALDRANNNLNWL